MNKKVREIIKKEIELIFEDYRYLYDQNTYTPTDEVIRTSERALKTVEQNNLVNSNGSNEGSGLEKAKSICKKEPMTHAQVKRMKAYFDNNKSIVDQEKVKGKTLETSGILQSWDLWGGDAGQRWANTIINQVHDRNNISKTTRGASGIRTKTLMDPHNTRIHR